MKISGWVCLLIIMMGAGVSAKNREGGASGRLAKVHNLYIKGDNEATGSARNTLADSSCFTVVMDEAHADSILEITGGVAGGSLIHVPFTGQKQYGSATLFERSTGTVLWTSNKKSVWRSSPDKVGQAIAKELIESGGCRQGQATPAAGGGELDSMSGGARGSVDSPLLGLTGAATDSGLKITSVWKGSRAEKIYLKPGDVIVSVDSRDVHSASEVEAIVAASRTGRVKILFLTSTGLGTVQVERDLILFEKGM